MKKWYSVELNHEQAENLKAFLKENQIYFEPSACYNLIHFEIKMDGAEAKMVNDYLENL